MLDRNEKSHGIAAEIDPAGFTILVTQGCKQLDAIAVSVTIPVRVGDPDITGRVVLADPQPSVRPVGEIVRLAETRLSQEAVLHGNILAGLHEIAHDRVFSPELYGEYSPVSLFAGKRSVECFTDTLEILGAAEGRGPLAPGSAPCIKGLLGKLQWNPFSPAGLCTF